MANMVECVLTMRGAPEGLDWLDDVLTTEDGMIDLSDFGPAEDSELGPDGSAPVLPYDEDFLYEVRTDLRDADTLVVCFRTKWTSPIGWLNALADRDETEDVTFDLLFGEEDAAFAGRRVWMPGSDDSSLDVDIESDTSRAYRFIESFGWDFGWEVPTERTTTSALEAIPGLSSGLVRHYWRGPIRLQPGMLTFAEQGELLTRAQRVAFIREFAKTRDGLACLADLLGWSVEQADESAALHTEEVLEALLSLGESVGEVLQNHDATAEVMYADRARAAAEFLEV